MMSDQSGDMNFDDVNEIENIFARNEAVRLFEAVGLDGAEAAREEVLPPDVVDMQRKAGRLVAFGLPRNLHLREGTEWCLCEFCVDQDDWENRYCCKEVVKIMEKNKDQAHTGCITSHPWFEAAILNPATLQIAYWQYRSQYDEPLAEGSVERRFRYTAYRQFVRWCWTFLGKDNRVPLPACVMQKIRQCFPDPNANYTGFKYPNLHQN